MRAALAYARRGVRSCAEVAAYLARQGIVSVAAARAVAQGRRQGWLNDLACGQLWAAHWARLGYARAVIQARLHAKGLSDTVIRQSLLKASVPEDQEALRAMVAQIQPVKASARTLRQLWGRLRRRGFDDELIEQALGTASSANL